MAVDGTKIRADAGTRCTGNVEEFRQHRGKIERKIEKLLHHTMDESSEGQSRRKEKLDTLEREKAKIEAFLTEVEHDETTPKGKVSLTDPNVCILCCACVKNCPAQARVMDNSQIQKIVEWLSTNFRERKEPEMYF